MIVRVARRAGKQRRILDERGSTILRILSTPLPGCLEAKSCWQTSRLQRKGNEKGIHESGWSPFPLEFGRKMK